MADPKDKQGDDGEGSFADWIGHVAEGGNPDQAAIPKSDGPRKVPNANTGKPKDGGTSKDGSQKPLNQGGATKPKASAGPGLAPARPTDTGAIKAPSTVQLGDLEVGKHAVVEVPVFNMTASDYAWIHAQLEGTPGVRVKSEPFTVRPGETGKAIQLEFRPEVEGRVNGTLRIRPGWGELSEQPPAEITVSLVGGAHVGDQTLDEQDAARTAREKEVREEATAKRKSEENNKRVDDDLKNHPKPFHGGNQARLAGATKQAENSLLKLYRTRLSAIMQADTVIGEFTRMLPPEHHSTLAQIAWFALDIASAGIAGGVAKRLEPALAVLLGSSGRPGGDIHYPNTTDNYQATGSRQISAIAPQDATRAVVAIFADGIKAGIKTAGSALKGEAKGEKEGPSEAQLHGGVSVLAKAEFLRQQRDALAAQDEKIAGDVTIDAFNTLLLGLDAAPEAMIGTMKAVATALDAAAEPASDLQVRETVTQWVRLVAQTSLGTVQTPDGKALTAIGGANRAPTLDQPVPPRDGLIDISFTGDDRDSMAFQLGKVRVNGITNPALEALTGKDGRGPARSLRQLGLAIRVSGMMGANDSSVTVVRDEAGNLEYTDRTGRSWFARRIGVMTHATDADQRRGARQLLDQEILDRALLSLNPETDAKPESK